MLLFSKKLHKVSHFLNTLETTLRHLGSPRPPPSFFNHFSSLMPSSSLPLEIAASHTRLMPWDPCHHVRDLLPAVTLPLIRPWGLTPCLCQGTPSDLDFLSCSLSLSEGSALVWAMVTAWSGNLGGEFLDITSFNLIVVLLLETLLKTNPLQPDFSSSIPLCRVCWLLSHTAEGSSTTWGPEHSIQGPQLAATLAHASPSCSLPAANLDRKF